MWTDERLRVSHDSHLLGGTRGLLVHLAQRSDDDSVELGFGWSQSFIEVSDHALIVAGCWQIMLPGTHDGPRSNRCVNPPTDFDKVATALAVSPQRTAEPA
jgi:hypothetical protein